MQKLLYGHIGTDSNLRQVKVRYLPVTEAEPGVHRHNPKWFPMEIVYYLAVHSI